MITVVCFKWFDPRGRYNDRFVYTAEHVNRLKRMVDRHLSLPHSFACITDDPQGLDPKIRTLPIETDMVRRAGHRYPKLMIFRPDAADWLGGRILMLDLDTMIVGSLDPLVDRDDDFVAWQDPGYGKKSGRGKYNTSMVLLRAGSHPEVWDRFDPLLQASSGLAETAGFSDQAWVSDVLGPGLPVWTRRNGVLSLKRDLPRRSWLARRRDRTLPTRLPWRARIVFFHGGIDPADPDVQAMNPWIARNWL